MALKRRVVAGVDSSTQSCKVVSVDADSGELLQLQSAPHPDGTSINPARWWEAFEQAGGADAAAGLAVIERVGCAACHRIPGVDWPTGAVGGSLAGFADRSMIAGRFPNQPQALAVWVRNAPSMDPTTGMPAMPISPAEARDVAAYLYTLEDD